MKKLMMILSCCLVGGAFAEDVILFGYDGSPLLSAGGGTPNYTPVAGVDTYLYWSTPDAVQRTDKGSTDTTWGSFAGDNSAFVSTNGNFNRGSIGIDDTEALFLAVTNNTGSDLELTGIHLDYKRAFWNSLNAVGVVVMGGDLDPISYKGNIAFSSNSGTPDVSDWEDAAFSLSSALTNNVLADGEYVLLELRGSSALDNRPRAVYFDNIAISGNVIPTVPDVVNADIVEVAPFSGNVMRLVMSSEFPEFCFPKVSTDLTAGTNGWSAAAHSTNGVAPFVVTNLEYSAASGSNYVIYVEAASSNAFFKIGAE